MGFIDPFQRAQGTFAEFVPVPARFVSRRPPSIDDRLGAALPCVGVTAVTLCDLAQVGRDSRVLVNGASGGVGHLAVQVAKARGARVTAVASAGRRDFVTSLGADAFIDYRTTPADRVARRIRRRARLRAEPAAQHARAPAPARRALRQHPARGSDLHHRPDPEPPRGSRAARGHAAAERARDARTRPVRRAGKAALRDRGRLRARGNGQAIEASRAGHVAGKLLIRVA